MKQEMKLNGATYTFDDSASFEGKDGNRIEYISLRKVKFDKYSQGGKPKIQQITISKRDKEAVYQWLRKCLGVQ